MPRTPTKKVAGTPKRASPGRKKGRVASLKTTIAKGKSGKSNPALFVWGMAEEFCLEIYIYTVNENNDGFTFPYKQYATGVKTVKALEDANFVSFKNRKLPLSKDQIMVDEKGFWRTVMLRKPEGGVSTIDTRAEGLKVLKEFFMHPDTTAFPPKDIATSDQTNDEEPHALGNFLQDRDVMEVLKDTFDEHHLGELFFETFPALAALVWSDPPYPECALQLGFNNP